MARAAVLTLLLACAGAAAWVAWDAHHDRLALRAREREVAALLDRSVDAIAGITAAQRAYVAPAQTLRPWLDGASALVQQIYRDMAALGTQTRTAGGLEQVEMLEATLSELVDIDTRIRERLRLGDLHAAAGLIFDTAAPQAGAAADRLRDLRTSELTAFRAGETGLLWRTAAAGGMALLLAAVAVAVAIARPPAPPARAADAGAAPPSPGPPPPAAAPGPSVDLQALADVCTSLSRATSAEALPDLLARAAQALDASGLIVWLDTGGRLSAVAAHGYPAGAVARMGSIERTADHATAEAWRTGTLRTVAGAGSARGAIVAPVFGSRGCAGVVAVEVPPGAEADAARQAATTLLAAQLAATLATGDTPEAP